MGQHHSLSHASFAADRAGKALIQLQQAHLCCVAAELLPQGQGRRVLCMRAPYFNDAGPCRGLLIQQGLRCMCGMNDINATHVRPTYAGTALHVWERKRAIHVGPICAPLFDNARLMLWPTQSAGSAQATKRQDAWTCSIAEFGDAMHKHTRSPQPMGSSCVAGSSCTSSSLVFPSA